MEASLQERKLRVTRRLEFTLDNTHSILEDINNRVERIVMSNNALERMVETYEVWSGRNV